MGSRDRTALALTKRACFFFQIDPHAFSLYDAVYLYALAVEKSLVDERPPDNSSYVIQYLTDVFIKGGTVCVCLGIQRADPRYLFFGGPGGHFCEYV